MNTRLRYVWSWLSVCTLAIILLPMELMAGKRQFTVVLDAGHGGKDAGAIGYGYREKDIVLSVALKLGKRIKSQHPEVRVLYTRERDVFVGLQARADFANKHKASLFISIHANSAGKSTAVSGTETYVLGLHKKENNLSVAMRENKVMLLEDNYQSIYKGYDPTKTESHIIFDVAQEAYIERSIDMADFVERQYRRQGRSSRGVRQEGLWVLSQSAMPAILTEIGFISNEREASYMNSSKGQDEIATALARAFTQFYAGRDAIAPEPASEEVNKTESADGEDSIALSEAKEGSRLSGEGSRSSTSSKRRTAEEKGLRYRVQFMSSPDKLDVQDKSFKRLKESVRRERLGSLWVYTIGNSTSLSEARSLQKSIRKWYPDSFVVAYKQGKRQGRA